MSDPIDVDFLPPQWRARRARRRALLLRLAIGSGALLALAGAEAWLLHRSFRLDSEMEDVGRLYAAARGKIGQVEQLDANKQALARRLDVLKDVLKRARGAVLVSAVTESTPRDVTLSKIEFHVDEKDGSPRTQLTIQGWCPNHVDVADFLGALIDEPSLTDVRMVYSEDKDERRAKEFVLVAESSGVLAKPHAPPDATDASGAKR